LALAIYLGSRGRMPYLENVFGTRGLGTPAVISARLKPALLVATADFWLGVTLLAGLGLALLVNFAARREWPRHVALTALLPAGALALATLAGSRFYDRYVAIWMVVAALVAAARRESDRPPGAAWAAAAVIALFSIAGARDFFAWNRAKWSLG